MDTTFSRDNICHIVEAPAAGVFAVELFLTKDGQILPNEVAPRPHNSGHHTIESCYTSQYEQHLRAILGLPLGDPSMKTPAAIMYNILGEDEGEPGFYLAHQLIGKALKGNNLVVGVVLHIFQVALVKNKYMTKVSVYGRRCLEVLIFDLNVCLMAAVTPRVAIIMGSDSDLPTMKDAAEILKNFGVPYEVTIVSAHRTPERMYSFASSAKERGIQIIIAGAGGASHLPGMVASLSSTTCHWSPDKNLIIGWN
ncbi:unnamed protein product [Musa banksii]